MRPSLLTFESGKSPLISKGLFLLTPWLCVPLPRIWMIWTGRASRKFESRRARRDSKSYAQTHLCARRTAIRCGLTCVSLSEIARRLWNKLAKVDQTSLTEDRASRPLRRNPTHTPIETLVLMTGVLGELAKAAKLKTVSQTVSYPV